VKSRSTALLLSLWLLLGCGSGVGPRQRLAPPQTNDVIFIGDSISFLWAEDPDFQTHATWIDKGISGQTSYQVAERFGDDVIALHPRAVHIIVGTNDVYPDWRRCDESAYGLAIPNYTCSNILYMVQTAQYYGIKVVLGTIPPWGCAGDPHCGASTADETSGRYNRIVELNNFVKELGAHLGVTVVDYHSILQDAPGLHYAAGLTIDGVHPSLQGYQSMTPAAAGAVK
jgi:lysophospholipase L1-like esterase